MGFLKKMKKDNRPLHIEINPEFKRAMDWMKYHGYLDAPDTKREEMIEHAKRDEEVLNEMINYYNQNMETQ